MTTAASGVAPASPDPQQVLLVDDLPDALALVHQAVVLAFPAAQCVFARSLREGLAGLEGAEHFDLALVDLSLGDGNGVQLIEALNERQPRCTVVVSSIHGDDDSLFQALQAGAHGYLLKDHPPEWLAQQLRGITQGQPPLSPAIARRLLRHFQRPSPLAPAPAAAPADPLPALTAREREVLGLLAQGVRLADIGTTLGISRHTAGDHVKNVYRKLNISSRAAAALHARQLGLA